MTPWPIPLSCWVAPSSRDLRLKSGSGLHWAWLFCCHIINSAQRIPPAIDTSPSLFLSLFSSCLLSSLCCLIPTSFETYVFQKLNLKLLIFLVYFVYLFFLWFKDFHLVISKRIINSGLSYTIFHVTSDWSVDTEVFLLDVTQSNPVWTCLMFNIQFNGAGFWINGRGIENQVKLLRVTKKTLQQIKTPFSHFLLTGTTEGGQEMMQPSLKLMPPALQ